MSTSADDEQPAIRRKEQQRIAPMTNFPYLLIVAPLVLICENHVETFLSHGIAERVVTLVIR